MIRSVVRIAALVLGFLLVFVVLVGPGLLEAPFFLLFGWWPSFIRFSKAWHFSSHSLVLLLISALVLVTGTHLFVRWVYVSVQEKAGLKAWPWKWTLCGFGIFLCTLLSISCMVLTTHQLYWISKSSDPLFTDGFRERIHLIQEASMLQQIAEENQWDGQKIREAFWKQGSRITGQPMLEAIQPVWVEGQDHRLRAIILIPRRPMHRARARFTVLQGGINQLSRPLDELSQVLDSFEAGNHAGKAMSQGSP